MHLFQGALKNHKILMTLCKLNQPRHFLSRKEQISFGPSLINLIAAEDVEACFLKDRGFGGGRQLLEKKSPQKPSFSQEHACLNTSSLCETFLHIRGEFPTEIREIQLSACRMGFLLPQDVHHSWFI